MRRPQFSLKTMLWLMLVVAVLCATWQLIKPPYRQKDVWNNSVERRYIWRNGTAVTISHEGIELPTIRVETDVDVSGWED